MTHTPEPDETFFVNLTSPTNATISDIQGLGTIQNDDNNASIAGTVYNDLNGNGSFDIGEPGIAGVTVSLTGSKFRNDDDGRQRRVQLR